MFLAHPVPSLRFAEPARHPYVHFFFSLGLLSPDDHFALPPDSPGVAEACHLPSARFMLRAYCLKTCCHPSDSPMAVLLTDR